MRQIQYKGEWAGRQIVQIDRCYPSSKRCSGCGYLVASLPLNVRSWACP
ncbi:transposase [Azomonas macrocytogenes]|nr:transposase [Azomonas macrocytogenes]